MCARYVARCALFVEWFALFKDFTRFNAQGLDVVAVAVQQHEYELSGLAVCAEHFFQCFKPYRIVAAVDALYFYVAWCVCCVDACVCSSKVQGV